MGLVSYWVANWTAMPETAMPETTMKLVDGVENPEHKTVLKIFLCLNPHMVFIGFWLENWSELVRTGYHFITDIFILN